MKNVNEAIIKPSTIKQLKKDVRFLTTQLGNIIKEQEGEKFFNKVEKIRTYAKDIRQNHNPETIAKQQKLIESLTLDEAYKITRAFTIYFQLVNIAEEMHRVRRTREYEMNPNLIQDMSIRKLFNDLKKEKVPKDKIKKFFSKANIELVLTAHPTEAKRRTVMGHLLEIASCLNLWNVRSLTWPEREELSLKIRSALEILWQTGEVRQKKIQVLDEVDQTLFFFRRTILDLVPKIHETIRREFKSVFEEDIKDVSSFLRFGSWVGGDRDGNPHVTCEVTQKTAEHHRDLIFKTYLSSIEDFIRQFSQSIQRVNVSRKLEKSLEKDKKYLPALAKEMEKFEQKELYRKKLTFIHRKIRNTYKKTGRGYESSKDFIEDINLINDSLNENKGLNSSKCYLENLLDQAKSFEFHLAKIDFRDHSSKLRQAMKEIFQKELKTEEIIEKLEKDSNETIPHQMSPDSKDVLNQLRTLRGLSEAFHQTLTEDYLISMTESSSDILSLLYLSKLVGLTKVKGGKVVKSFVSVIPLFEKILDLANAPKILEELFSTKIYRSYLASRGNTQEIMLGYSDSNKDGGYFPANWKLYLAMKKLAEIANKHKINLRFFHGKGGTIDRGGGASHRAILAQPYAAFDGQIKITEQGEVISQKYSNPIIAQRNIEQLITAVAWNNLVSRKRLEENPKRQEWENRMNQLSDLAYFYYRDLVHSTEGFMKFYREATPIQIVEMTKIGSRPARRKSSENIEDLRAIPWVFSWIQSRYIFSSWYGIGFALKKYIEQNKVDGLKHLREMYAEWPFFTSLIDNVQASLAKTDLYIAKNYAALTKNPELRNSIHGKLFKEHRRTIRMILQITGQKQILEEWKVLRESIRLRNPYVDPLNFIQVYYLQKLRQNDFSKKSEDYKSKVNQILLLTVNGVSFGMKSTG